MTILGGLLIALGSFLPRLTAMIPLVGTVNTNGMQGGGDGIITLVLGIILVLIGVAQLTGNLSSRLQVAAIPIGILTVVVAVNAYSGAEDRIASVQAASSLAAASIGAGIYVLFVGAAFAIAGGWFARRGWPEHQAKEVQGE
jgi:hypothetical protein